jgi:hypothetical protein
MLMSWRHPIVKLIITRDWISSTVVCSCAVVASLGLSFTCSCVVVSIWGLIFFSTCGIVCAWRLILILTCVVVFGWRLSLIRTCAVISIWRICLISFLRRRLDRSKIFRHRRIITIWTILIWIISLRRITGIIVRTWRRWLGNWRLN